MPEPIKSWRDLLVWQKAHQAALEIYRETKAFPGSERFRITDQLCRAAVSVPTNIAEGKGRGSKSDFRHFLVISRGSVEEVRYLLLLSYELGCLKEKAYSALEARYTEISKMLISLIRSLEPR